MNSCIQTLKNIPEMSSELQKFEKVFFYFFRFQGKNENDLSEKLTLRTKELFQQLGKQNTPYSPISFVAAFRQAHPRFSQTVPTPMGESFAQQDADEFWNTLINSLKTSSKDLFKGELEVTIKNVEAEEETKLQESFHKLPCEISKETSNIEFGINQSLTTSIEKNSTVLGRNAVFTKVSKISSLPSYLSVNMVRFYWKSKEQVKAKVNKKFSLSLGFERRQISFSFGCL
jgi:ubiquitin carboxyl-terminal hydrolase 14